MLKKALWRLAKFVVRRFIQWVRESEAVRNLVPVLLVFGGLWSVCTFAGSMIAGAFGKNTSAAVEVSTPASAHVTHRYAVQLRETAHFTSDKRGNLVVGQDAFNQLVREHNAVVTDMHDGEDEGTTASNWVVVSDDEQLLEELSANPDVAYAEVDRVATLLPGDDFNVTAEDPAKTWNLRVTQTREARAALKPTSDPVIVAVVDTGVQLDHPAIKDSLVQGRNIVDNNDDPSNKTPDEMHATHVTGTIVMKPEDSIGLAYKVAKVMPVRVLNEHGSGSMIDVAKGIVWAADNGARVINMSLGSAYYFKGVHDACKYAVSKGVVVVAARGNSGNDRLHFPACHDEVLSVNATGLSKDGVEERAYFSSYGKDSNASAPGHLIYSSIPGNKYRFASGTSMASPHVTAAAAVIISQRPNLTVDEVRHVIEKAGDEVKSEKPIGKRINLLKFVKAVQTANEGYYPVRNVVDNPIAFGLDRD